MSYPHGNNHHPLEDRIAVISWATPFLAVALLAFLFTSSIGQSQAQAPSINDPRARSFLGAARSQTAQQLICSISSFYSVDANEQVSDVIHIEGRGLAACRNDQGFSTDIPVSSVITARAVGDWANAGELSFSGNSASFVITREIGQMQDTYSVKPFASDLADKTSPTVLFGGQRHDVLIEMRFSSSTQSFRKLEIQTMALHFDETAPTLD